MQENISAAPALLGIGGIAAAPFPAVRLRLVLALLLAAGAAAPRPPANSQDAWVACRSVHTLQWRAQQQFCRAMSRGSRTGGAACTPVQLRTSVLLVAMG